MPRDDFAVRIRDALAKRVNFCCSNPGCGKATSGPHSDPARALNIGVAAHITAAAAGGPRYDETLTAQARSSFLNGIWLCQSCGKLADNDPALFTVAVLRRWKEQAEEKALSALAGLLPADLPQPASAKHTPLPRIRWLPYELARAQLIANGWHPMMRHWSDDNDPDICLGNGPHYWRKGFWEIIRACPTGTASCAFAFKDAYGHVLEIVTEGDADPESGADAIVMSWQIQDAALPADRTGPTAKPRRLTIEPARRLTPPNVLESIAVGTPSEKVRERLGVPDLVAGARWQYRFTDTQVEVALNSERNVNSVVIALVLNCKYHGLDAPFGDFVLGEITVQDLIEMEHKTFIYRDSMRTKELIVSVRTGPAGAWSECFFGALVVHSGVGHLAETAFEWDSESDHLNSLAKDTVLNWVGVGRTAGEPPYFDWHIKG